MLPYQLPVFACGILAFFLIRNGALACRAKAGQALPPVQIMRRNRFRAWLLLGVFAYAFWALPSIGGRSLPPTVSWSLAFMVLTLSLSLWEIPLLVNGFFRYLGKISYSVYLTHLIVLQPVIAMVLEYARKHQVHWKPLKYFLITLALTLAISMIFSTITYWLIEQPGQWMGRRLIDRLERHHVPQPRLAETAASL
jgi:peptidoglycan/LPS O-acetylase OafA/YrhL